MKKARKSMLKKKIYLTHNITDHFFICFCQGDFIIYNTKPWKLDNIMSKDKALKCKTLHCLYCWRQTIWTQSIADHCWMVCMKEYL
jgi:hypothetical protein